MVPYYLRDQYSRDFQGCLHPMAVVVVADIAKPKWMASKYRETKEGTFGHLVYWSYSIVDSTTWHPSWQWLEMSWNGWMTYRSSRMSAMSLGITISVKHETNTDGLPTHGWTCWFYSSLNTRVRAHVDVLHCCLMLRRWSRIAKGSSQGLLLFSHFLNV